MTPSWIGSLCQLLVHCLCFPVVDRVICWGYWFVSGVLTGINRKLFPFVHVPLLGHYCLTQVTSTCDQMSTVCARKFYPHKLRVHCPCPVLHVIWMPEPQFYENTHFLFQKGHLISLTFMSAQREPAKQGRTLYCALQRFDTLEGNMVRCLCQSKIVVSW